MPTRGILATTPTRRQAYDVTFNSVAMGFVDDVDPTGIKGIYKPITVGSMGKDLIIGYRLVGFQGTVKIKFRQLDNVQYQGLAPWWSGSGAIPLTPPLNSDLYAYSKVLLLHPQAASGTTEDVPFSKACPITIPVPKLDGGTDDELTIEFMLFPDRAVLASTPTVISPGTILNA